MCDDDDFQGKKRSFFDEAAAFSSCLELKQPPVLRVHTAAGWVLIHDVRTNAQRLSHSGALCRKKTAAVPMRYI